MKKRMSKKAQFYIIAAVIIAVVLLGLFATKNYIRVKPKDIKFYDLSKELNLESGYVIDYGVYNQEDTDLDSLVDEWASIYVDYSSKVTGVGEWIFVYGDKESVDAIVFTKETSGIVSIQIGSGRTDIIITDEWKQKVEDIGVTPGTDTVILISPDGTEYEFNLNKGENFFFVISKGEFVSAPGIPGPAGIGEDEE